MNKIGIFTVPRSGSTWLGQIFNSSPEVLYKFQPNFAYSFPMNLSETASKNEISRFFEELENSEDTFVNAGVSLSGETTLKFTKSNLKALVFKEVHYLNIVLNLLQKSDLKIVGLIRSPFGVINSWLNAPKEFESAWNIKDEWRTGKSKNQNRKTHFFGYNKWVEAAKLFIDLEREYPDRFYLINYDDILSDTLETINELFLFCDLSVSQQTQKFIYDSRNSNHSGTYSVYKRKKRDLEWQKTLPSYIISEIKKDPDFQNLNKIFNWI